MTKADPDIVALDVTRALDEDIGTGDVSAQLIPADQTAHARIISREPAVLSGIAWADAAFRRVSPNVRIEWAAADGDSLFPEQSLCLISGPARPMLTAERVALNFLQTLSATATVTRQFVEAVEGTGAQILDTRKTLPGLRYAQKKAVTDGGGMNHRMGLHDMVMLKENHIRAAGSITEAVRAAGVIGRDLPLEVEVETLEQLDETLAAGVKRVLLDNFSLEQLGEAVEINRGRAKLESSGNVSLETVRDVAETGVDYISIGALTKHVQAVDLSMRFVD
ncbi:MULTISPECIES: carboxylating nicotinate-nucleotide diphosphorylase [unclassified Guyparkeria]|uniref:carboxylating nicotinate-nucleotide diphosphorylase n=1 Tax=unclassified Guyparkeria TaxID=2626246 RepID=UPI000733587E|nr:MULTISPECIES: carboxylating nicotinate-nucleotide diphosphorylase [unclassified Guyparkeria]KTG16572.1 nicotinate-nucleotide pyrophosphorylase [Guyparkeria sp. XI15]OAE85606.1 nicotinate-nucleotide pyrophosphorylase [Guyparkeria sp. WRN-7]